MKIIMPGMPIPLDIAEPSWAPLPPRRSEEPWAAWQAREDAHAEAVRDRRAEELRERAADLDARAAAHGAVLTMQAAAAALAAGGPAPNIDAERRALRSILDGADPFRAPPFREPSHAALAEIVAMALARVGDEGDALALAERYILAAGLGPELVGYLRELAR